MLMTTEPVPERIRALERPHPALWTYYIIRAILTGPGLVFLLPYLYFRYHTLRYRLDEEGIHMKVGILFRRETNLTYARIQDIHLRSGLLQRWLGLANLQVQTASGSAGPELVIEGFKEYEAIRDFLYTRMRGYQVSPHAPRAAVAEAPGGVAAQASGAAAVPAAAAPAGGEAELVSLLNGIRDELRRTRELLEARGPAARAPKTSPAQPQPPSHV
jgi:membrane protein YdbS with pleckstrin-like domain